jgi:hypothetical protein
MSERVGALASGGDSELEHLRQTAQRSGASTEHDVGWFGRVLQERLGRRGTCRDWDALYPTLSEDERAGRRIARACRKAALGGGLSSAGAHASAAATLLSDGVAPAIGVPTALAAIAADTVYSAVVQVDLACDLASIYRVPFMLQDTGELATVFDIALRGPNRDVPAKSVDARRILAPNDAEMLARVGDHMARNAFMGLVPLLGIPLAAAESYADTRDLGKSACEYARDRRAVIEVIGTTLLDPDVDEALLLGGAWLLATNDDVLTHEEAVLLSTLARKVPPDRRAPLEHLGFIGEGVWIVHMGLLGDAQCEATWLALEAVAGLRGKTADPARRFLERAAAALGRTVDLARIDDVHRRFALSWSGRRRTPRPSTRLD